MRARRCSTSTARSRPCCWCGCSRIASCSSRRPAWRPSTLEALDHYLFSEKVDARRRDRGVGAAACSPARGPRRWPSGDRSRPPGRAVVAASPPRSTGSRCGSSRGGGETGGAEVWVGVPAADGASASRRRSPGPARRPSAPTALESLRIEAGTPRFGRDIGPAVLLPEVPFEPLLSHTKGCYPGQEVVVRIRDRGHVNRHLRGLVVDGRRGAAARRRGRRRRRGDRRASRAPRARSACSRPIALGPRSAPARRAGHRRRGPRRMAEWSPPP